MVETESGYAVLVGWETRRQESENRFVLVRIGVGDA